MTFGEEWGWGVDREGSKAIYRAFREAGGNCIDTANRYTEGTSERYLGVLAADLDESQLSHLTAAGDFELGFPHDFLADDMVRDIVFGGCQDLIDNHRRL